MNSAADPTMVSLNSKPSVAMPQSIHPPIPPPMGGAGYNGPISASPASYADEVAPADSMDLDLLVWEGDVRRLAVFQIQENLPLLEKLLNWARTKATEPERIELLKKLRTLNTAETQLAEVETLLAASK